MAEFTINPLLAYSQYNVGPQYQSSLGPCLISWDMRAPPERAHYLGPKQPLNFSELAQPATQPPLQTMQITCGIFPGHWPIKVHRTEGLTVGDILDAVRTVMMRRVTHTEWCAFGERERARITAVFNERCQAAANGIDSRLNGVLRMDCLLQHTLFGGLSVQPKAREGCIMSLRRAR